MVILSPRNNVGALPNGRTHWTMDDPTGYVRWSQSGIQMYPAFEVGLFKYQQVGTNMTPEASVENGPVGCCKADFKKNMRPFVWCNEKYSKDVVGQNFSLFDDYDFNFTTFFL